MRKGALFVAAVVAVISVVAVYPSRDAKLEPTADERPALEWVLVATRHPDAFPDQGMPEDARPVYVVFDASEPKLFHVVFEESDELYTGRYRLRPGDDPKFVTVRWGYGWFDLSQPHEDLKVWKLAGRRWELQATARGVDPIVGAKFEVTTYNLQRPAEPSGPRHLYVNGSGSNIGDGPGRAECYLIYGSQTALIEGDYLGEALQPGDTLVVSGDVKFPKRLDDYESGGLECEAEKAI